MLCGCILSQIMHPSRRICAITLWTLASQVVSGVEWQPPSRPRDVGTVILGDTPVTWIDWGVAGEARKRDPQTIREERESLERWLKSPELQARLFRLAQLGTQRETELVKQAMNRWMRDYETIEQPTNVPRRLGRQVDEVPLPSWANGIPPAMRTSMQIVFFDDRDPAQRAFVQERRQDTKYFTQVFATGWRSGKDRDEYWSRLPGAPVAPIPVSGDAFVRFYQITSFPAVITFGPVDTMMLQQGMDL